MEPGRPSRTSILVAAGRAFGAREPDPSVRNPDWLAGRFLGPAERQLISGPIAGALEQDYQEARKDAQVAAMANLMLMRTRFIDDRLRRSLDGGAKQVVILGAGFDTRAYRFEELLKDKRVFEVDCRATQELKKRRAEEVFGSLPPHVVFAEIDFKRGTLRDVLRGAGYQATEKTCFIWEGVCMYLPEEAVRGTLLAIRTGSAPGSSLIMDFAGRASIGFMERFPNHPQHEFTTAWGEPWIFGVPDNHEREFFLECGLELRETLRFGRAASKRYLTRADGSRLGQGRFSLKMLWQTVPLVWWMITRRSKWYALAELVVPERAGPVS